jgi:hypothetical protein
MPQLLGPTVLLLCMPALLPSLAVMVLRCLHPACCYQWQGLCMHRMAACAHTTLLLLLPWQVYTKLNNMQACTQMLKTFKERYTGNIMRVSSASTAEHQPLTCSCQFTRRNFHGCMC